MLIAVLGRARVGKDTFANILAEELYNILRKKFVLMAYGNELKKKVQQDFDLHYEQLWGDEKEIEDKRYSKTIGDYWTPREILQEYGEFYRSIDSYFWIRRVFEIIEHNEYKNVIITDARHFDEADAVVGRNGFIIRIMRDEVNRPQIHNANHISEIAMDSYDKVDFTIENNGSIEDLRETAKSIARVLISMQQNKYSVGGK